MKTRTTAAIFPYVEFHRKSPIPYYKQIYESYRSAILSGLLRPGQRLPSTRALALELNVSRLPVLNAFDQLLHEGYLEGRTGAGTYVKDSIPDELARPFRTSEPASLAQSAPLDVRSSTHPNIAANGLAPFRVSLPALDQFPHKTWARLVVRHAKTLTRELMAYGDPAGYFPLRGAIAEYVRTARAVHCEAAQVLIVSGSQMALQISAMALVKPGDIACIEEPGYPGARDALRVSGGKLAPIVLDHDGVDVSLIASQGKRARVAYVTPSHQYPLGISMSASRRLELLEWAERNQSWILEDDYDSEYRYASRPLGALQGMTSGSRVVYIGTFSKVLFPSLRLGYVIVPPPLIQKFLELREALDIFSPTLYQLVLTDFLQEGHFARHLRRMRGVYLSRRDALVESLKEHLGEILTPHNTDAGLHLSAFLPEGVDDVEAVKRAAQSRINATALSTCYAGATPRSGLILGFGGANERQIKAGVRTLAKVIREFV